MKGCPKHELRPQITCPACGDMAATRLREIRRNGPAPTAPTFRAFVDDGFIALEIPKSMIPPPELITASDGMLLRFLSADGFRNFMLQAIEHAALVWPEIAQEWKDVGETEQ